MKMRFKSRYARFENWDGEPEMTSGSKVSRLNADGGDFNDGFGQSSPFSGGSADILGAPGEDAAPF